MTSLLAAWKSAQDSIKEKIGESSYQSWFSHLNANATDATTLVLETPDEFFKNWIADNYLPIIQTALKDQGREDVTVELSVVTRARKTEAPAVSIPTKNEQLTKKATGLIQSSRFNFDNFVVGNSNRMTYAASRAVADSPAKAYNPLFIYGQTGLGKTHLMQSIANHILHNRPDLECMYLSSETFTNQLIEAIRNKSTPEFRQKFRTIDVLLIDDIQFIAGKESTQEEFFHTFNALHDSHKQVIVSSDRPPKEISKLEERLVTRFAMGLITDIQPPDYETRVAILRKKIELANVSVPDDVVYFIAEQIKTNIRELEGALIRVVAYSLFDEKTITLAHAQSVLKDMVKETMKTISIEMIQQAVAEHFHLSMNELKSKKRTQNIALPRQIAMYLTRKLTRHSFPEIGNAFGGKDHTTVLHACKKIEESLPTHSEIKYVVEKLSQVLNQ